MLTRGLAAGVVGTGCMTAWQTLSAKLESSDDGAHSDDGDKPATDPWDYATAAGVAAAFRLLLSSRARVAPIAS